MSDPNRLGFMLGLTASLCFVACALDVQGTAGDVTTSSQSSGAQGAGTSTGTSQGGASQGGASQGGNGGAAGGTGGGNPGGAGPGTGGQGGGSVCGLAATPAPTVIDCNAPDECIDMAIDCPPDADCIINCTGSSSCKGSTVITCPPGHRCEVNCDGPDACQDAVINCAADGVCKLVCGTQSQVCTNTRLNCGDQMCTAECMGTSEPDLQCNGACLCAPCM